MNYLTPGLRELSLKFGRLLNRLRLISARRTLARAETELGLLGWQQADYDADTQREVSKIENYEREQGRMTNESAELGQALRALVATRDTRRQEYEAARAELVAQRREFAAPLEKVEKQLAALRKQEPDLERRMPELDRELREVTRIYTELLSVEPQTPQVRDELSRARERTVAIPNEKADLRTQHLRVASEIKTLETRHAQDHAKIAEIDRQLAEHQAAFDAVEREITAEIRAKEREKSRLEREIDLLEKAKANPYQQIGRVLADSNIAPMNQPHALEKVRRHRFAVSELEYQITRSAQVSAANDLKLVRISYVVWGAMAVAVALIGAVVISAPR